MCKGAAQLPIAINTYAKWDVVFRAIAHTLPRIYEEIFAVQLSAILLTCNILFKTLKFIRPIDYKLVMVAVAAAAAAAADDDDYFSSMFHKYIAICSLCGGGNETIYRTGSIYENFCSFFSSLSSF